MSEAFEKAVEWVRSQVAQGTPLSTVMKDVPTFKDEKFTVNRVASVDPLIVGYSDPKLNIKINDATIRAVTRVAKMHGLDAIPTTNMILIKSGERNVAFVSPDGVYSSDGRVFTDLMVTIQTQPVDAPLKDSWLDSITQLVSSKLYDLVFTALLFFLLPTTLAAISLITTPSLWFPYPLNIVVTVLLFLISVYVIKKYLRENPLRR
ncbi:MAG: hypothetical protein NZ957_02975 [Thaumarchaeota archaeon]|nr:hypothetical protein [Candidatus Calditenuaceae archaeon]MDW8042214.1 hypothetical protein [Nitrososphaerota archaeon]